MEFQGEQFMQCCVMSKCCVKLVSRPEIEGGERAWCLLFEHALNCGGIPALWTIDLCLYICDVKTDVQPYVVHTLTHVS